MAGSLNIGLTNKAHAEVAGGDGAAFGQSHQPLVVSVGAHGAFNLILPVGHVLACEYVLGCHDLMIHDYGPHRCYATIHVETSGSMGAVECHALLDRIERECLAEMGVHLVIHHDPVHVDDPETRRVRQLTETVLKIKNEALILHDFRLSEKDGRPFISFDLVIPENFDETPETFRKSLCDALLALDGKEYEAEITFDLQ